ncbi:MAG: helix-turn-helix transcriptional regulator [Clostridia bacterium]|nr:helix-turn-helix transcriptional regulator [Clostridia bacterium]
MKMNIDLLSNMVITRVDSVTELYNPKGKKQKRVGRTCWAAVFKHEGSTEYVVNEKRFFSDRAHAVILPKGISYTWECTESGRFCIMEFDCELEASSPMTFSVKNGERLLKLFRELEYKRSIKGGLGKLEGIRDAYSVILALAEGEAELYLPTKRQSLLSPALDHISKAYNETITNELLAKKAGMSTVYFRKLFKSVMGTSPIAYARSLRIEKAKEMLKSDYSTLTDVAVSLGYQSLYDFSRDFKKHTGVAPSKFK